MFYSASRSAFAAFREAVTSYPPFSFSWVAEGVSTYEASPLPPPKPPPTPLHVRGGDIALLTQSVASLNLAFLQCGSRRPKFANLTSNLNVKP